MIYGGGAVGLGLASALINSTADVTIIARSKNVKALREGGLVREGIFGHHHAPPDSFRVSDALTSAGETGLDMILVCTKSYDSASVADALAANPALFHAQTKIVLCQNGWGNAELFLDYFKPEMLYNARVITGFQLSSPNTVNITVHVDDVHIGSRFGEQSDNIEKLCIALTRGGIPCVPTAEIVKDLWAKMLYNCALNPLGAIFGVPYGALGASSHTRTIMETVIREIFAVLEKTGYKTCWETPEAYLQLFFNTLIPTTAKHEASTLQDIKAGKRTEIDALNGAVVKLGDQSGVAVPANRQIYHMIKFLEKASRS